MITGIISLRLIVALCLGMIIGLERIYSGHDAGIRTHGIMSLGSALFIVLAISSAVEFNAGYSEVVRTIGQIVTGVGFLGGGLIFVSNRDNHKKGLTSAATLWTTSAIGIACGFGYFGIAILTTVLVMFSLTIMGNLEWAILKVLGKYEQNKQ